MIKNTWKTVVASAASAVLFAGGAHALTTTTLYLGGNGGLDDSHSYSSGSLTLDLTGHLQNVDGSIGSQEKIGQYSAGVGVTNNDEWAWQCSFYGGCGYVPSDEHFVDSTGPDEVVKFLFNMDVTIEKIWFTYVDYQDDFSFAVFDGSTVTDYWADVELDNSFYASYTFGSDWTSNMFGIGAAGNGDAFKIKAIQVSYDDTPAVPLPAAGWLLLGAFGGVGALRRKRAA